MKKINLLFVLLSVLSIGVKAQVGIGTLTPNPSSAIDIVSTTGGLLPPRMSAAEVSAITNPATGLQIFNTTTNKMEVNLGTPALPSWNSYDSNPSISPQISSIDCSKYSIDIISPGNILGEDPLHATLRLAYTGGNLGSYPQGTPFSYQSSSSYPIYTFTLKPGTLQSGDGFFDYDVVGQAISPTQTTQFNPAGIDPTFSELSKSCTVYNLGQKGYNSENKTLKIFGVASSAFTSVGSLNIKNITFTVYGLYVYMSLKSPENKNLTVVATQHLPGGTTVASNVENKTFTTSNFQNPQLLNTTFNDSVPNEINTYYISDSSTKEYYKLTFIASGVPSSLSVSANLEIIN